MFCSVLWLAKPVCRAKVYAVLNSVQTDKASCFLRNNTLRNNIMYIGVTCLFYIWQ